MAFDCVGLKLALDLPIISSEMKSRMLSIDNF